MATIDVKDAAGSTVAIEKPLAPGTAADSASRPVAFSTEGKAQLGSITETAPATDTASSGLNGRLQRVAQRLTTLDGKLDVIITNTDRTADAVEDTTDVSVDLTASELHIGQVGGYGFDVVSAPTVTNGAYSAGDIVGGLLSFAIARANDEAVIVNEIQISLKAAVTSSFSAVIFTADPTNTTKTDNAAYSLNAADAFKVRRSLAPSDFTLFDHGTPNTYSARNLNIVCKPASGSTTVYMLLIDGTGFTLTSTSDIQIRMVGTGV